MFSKRKAVGMNRTVLWCSLHLAVLVLLHKWQSADEHSFSKSCSNSLAAHRPIIGILSQESLMLNHYAWKIITLFSNPRSLATMPAEALLSILVPSIHHTYQLNMWSSLRQLEPMWCLFWSIENQVLKIPLNIFHEVGLHMNLISAEYYHKMFMSTNGLLLPGGARDLFTSGDEEVDVWYHSYYILGYINNIWMDRLCKGNQHLMGNGT